MISDQVQQLFLHPKNMKSFSKKTDILSLHKFVNFSITTISINEYIGQFEVRVVIKLSFVFIIQCFSSWQLQRGCELSFCCYVNRNTIQTTQAGHIICEVENLRHSCMRCLADLPAIEQPPKRKHFFLFSFFIFQFSYVQYIK